MLCFWTQENEKLTKLAQIQDGYYQVPLKIWNVKHAATREDSMVISYEINIHLPYNPANPPLGIL